MAGARFTIEVDDREVRETLAALIRQLTDPARAMRDIGEYLLRTTDERFRREIAPDGTRWAPNSDVTLARYLARRGAKALGAKKVLRDSGALQDTLAYQVTEGGRAVEVGTNRVYAAAQQFGMAKGYAGRTKRGAPIPWGDIHARPFLGLSRDDQEEALAILRDHLARVV